MSFVRRKDQVQVAYKKMFNGEGEAEMHVILNGADEMYNKGRVFNHVFLAPGAEIGWHIHKGDGETYYILSGEGEYNDNGNVITVYPGDVTFVDDGEGHSMKNVSDKPLEAIALILYK